MKTIDDHEREKREREKNQNGEVKALFSRFKKGEKSTDKLGKYEKGTEKK